MMNGTPSWKPFRKHADQSRRRAARTVPELHYRLDDHASKKFFFDEARLQTLSCGTWACGVRIGDMAAFRSRYASSALYEFLMERLVACAISDLEKRPRFCTLARAVTLLPRRRLPNAWPAATLERKSVFVRIRCGRKRCKPPTWRPGRLATS